MLVIEILTDNKINTFDSFILKSAYVQTKEKIERAQYGFANAETILKSNYGFNN